MQVLVARATANYRAAKPFQLEGTTRHTANDKASFTEILVWEDRAQLEQPEATQTACTCPEGSLLGSFASFISQSSAICNRPIQATVHIASRHDASQEEKNSPMGWMSRKSRLGDWIPASVSVSLPTVPCMS